MILGFKPQFYRVVTSGIKIHTLRADVNKRWKVGNKVHFAGNLRTKDYFQFGFGIAKQVHEVSIIHQASIKGVSRRPLIFLGDRRLTLEEQKAFAFRDGFDTLEQFFEWFNKTQGLRLICWVDTVMFGRRYMSRDYEYNVKDVFK